jgi:crotonobetainyl-CoA:carnitine CoA-transferase CaiB-like acyl-CoA transferase
VGPSPLEGLLVLELGQNVAAPYAGLVLRELGARVVKVERAQGDDTRGWGPPFWGPDSVVFAALNAGKESVVWDLDRDRDRQALLRLAKRADVLIQNWRPGALERRGLGPQDLRRLNHRLIYVSMTAFGPEGPLSAEPGYDPLVQAFCGIMSLGGEGDRPVRTPVSLLDLGTGLWCVLGVLLALRERDDNGQGTTIEVSLFETGLAWMPWQLAGVAAGAGQPARYGSGVGFIVPYQAFAAADGELMVSAGNDRLWQALCLAVDRPDLGADPSLATNRQRVEARDRVVRELERTFRQRSVGEWIDRLRAAGVPCSPIQDLPGVWVHPQTAATQMVTAVPHPQVPDFRLLGLPLRLDGLRPRPDAPPPRLGQHTAAVLAELGLEE